MFIALGLFLAIGIGLFVLSLFERFGLFVDIDLLFSLVDYN